jgi:hypothetical protein
MTYGAGSLTDTHDEAGTVLTWRYCVLRRAGYDEDAAAALAPAEVDLHTAVSLLERGCAPDTALAILL